MLGAILLRQETGEEEGAIFEIWGMFRCSLRGFSRGEMGREECVGGFYGKGGEQGGSEGGEGSPEGEGSGEGGGGN